MSDTNLTEVFCEVLSGLVLLCVIGLALHVSGVLSLEAAWSSVTAGLSLGGVATVLIVSYLLGLIMDAFGLAAGESFLDNWADASVPTAGEQQQFLETVPEHVLKYRDVQWAYYSTYRNLLLLFVPGGVLATIAAWRGRGFWAAVGVLLLAVVVSAALWRSMVALLGIYFRLSKIRYTQK